MEPLDVCHKAGHLANQGDLQGAIDLIDPLIAKYRDFGPAYVVHARVFLMAGDGAKAQALLKTVGGSDGTADLARLWTLYAKRKA